MSKRIGTIGHVNTFGDHALTALAIANVFASLKKSKGRAKPKAERPKTEREIWNDAVEAKKAEKKGKKA